MVGAGPNKDVGEGVAAGKSIPVGKKGARCVENGFKGPPGTAASGRRK